MTTFNDNFTNTGAASADLTTHTADSGETWARHTTETGALVANATNDRTIASSATTALYKSTWTPGSADYDVTGTLVKVGTNEGLTYLCGRMDATVGTYYSFGHYIFGASSSWYLAKFVAGSGTVLASYAAVPADGSSSTCKLEMRGTAIKGYVDGVERCSVTDSAITAAGLIGIRAYTGGAVMAVDVMGAVDAATSVALSGNTAMGDYTASGTIAPDGAMSMSGNTTMADYTLSGTIGVGTGTITTQAFKNWNGPLIAASTVIPFTKVIRCSDAATLQESANLALNGSSQLVMPNTLFVAGVKYLVVNFDATGTAFSAESYTAS